VRPDLPQLKLHPALLGHTPQHAEADARALRDAAAELAAAAESPGSSLAIGAVMEQARGALRMVSAACYRLAADAAPDVAPEPFPLHAHGPRRSTPGAPSREWQMAFTTALHEAATGMARAARLCDAAGQRATRLLERRPRSNSGEAR
jgi:hypothetical protein